MCCRILKLVWWRRVFSGVFTGLAFILSGHTIYGHLTQYFAPRLQKYIVRILLLVPIYAGETRAQPTDITYVWFSHCEKTSVRSWLSSDAFVRRMFLRRDGLSRVGCVPHNISRAVRGLYTLQFHHIFDGCAIQTYMLFRRSGMYERRCWLGLQFFSTTSLCIAKSSRSGRSA